MYTIIKETNGASVEYTVVDMRNYKQVSPIFETKEEANKHLNNLNQKLYKGSGVFGNEI